MYEKGFVVQNEIFLKLIIIFFMSIFIVALGISAYFMGVNYNEKIVYFHTGVGIIFLIILPMHIYLRKDKLKKMILDFYRTVLDKEEDSGCKNQKLLKTLKNRSLEEFCQKLHVDVEKTLIFLSQKNIAVESIEDNFQKISEQNGYDSLKIFAMIIENHMRVLK